MLDARKAAILSAVVTEYIETALPVGSNHVAGRPDLGVSPATVRHEMSVLEREGYLIQPHTSAGRVPTEKGYRFFVNSIEEPALLDPARSLQVKEFFSTAHGELERMLADTSRLLAGLTDYAAVVVKPSNEAAIIRSVQVVELGSRLALAVAVLSTGVVEKRALELAEEHTSAQISAASVHLATHLDGAPWGSALLVTQTGDPAVDRLVARTLEALAAAASSGDNAFVGGAARMASAFAAAERARQVMEALEQRYVLASLLADLIDRGLSVAIGTEHGLAQLADCSIVVAPYEVEGELAGSVGILGPTRMHYSQVLAAVAVVSRRLSRALSEGSSAQ